jgi:hypothetical protein
MADTTRSEVLIITNGSGLSKSANVKAWKDWASDLPTKVVSGGLEDVAPFEGFTHAWIADANYLPFASAFRSEMRKQIPVTAEYAVFSVTKPLAARHFYDEKWTTDQDKHDKFGGIRYLNTKGLASVYQTDQTFMGREISFVSYQASRLGFPYCVFQLASNEPKIIVDENFVTVQHVYHGAHKMAFPEFNILDSHKELASRSDTDIFVVFDADFQLDTELLNDEFKPWELDSVHVWYARNPVNGLEYGHGGPKAFNRNAFTKLDDRTVDVTTNASSSRLTVHRQCVGVHAFNWSPMSTWRTAFREAAKLSMGINTIVDADQYKEAFFRLDTWCKVAKPDVDYGDLCTDGATCGRKWVERVNNRADVLKINDFAWLEDEFQKRHGPESERG